jgi:exodeoxyribonuclease V alpha subunit
MSKSKSSKDLCSHLFQKYSSIRNEFELSETIENDFKIVHDKTFIFIQLLTSCDMHANSLFKLLNIFRFNEEYCFSKIIENPYKFVILPDNVMNFEKANDIANKFSLEIEETCIKKAFIYDLILFKSNTFYIDKNTLISKYIEKFSADSVEELFEDLLVKVTIEKRVYYTVQELMDLELNMGDIMVELYYDKCLKVPENVINTFIKQYENSNEIKFTKNQIKGITNAIENKFSLICGFPGTGKSTVADCICKYYENKHICLTAPTGMAVNNIRLKCNLDSSSCMIGTLHKLLFDAFIEKKESSSINIIIIDEFSMVDNVLFYKVLQWCKVFNCKLICLADDLQLPPIGGGYPLGAIIASKMFKTVFLKTIKRQDNGSLKNVILKLSKNEQIVSSDFDKESVFFYNYSNENLINLIKKYDLNHLNTQFISPQHKHVEGCVSINNLLQTQFSQKNSNKIFSKLKKNFVIQENDMIVRTVNNYTEKELHANGDIAFATKNREEDCINIKYLSKKPIQKVSVNELYEEFSLAYCLTVHKVQGSQYENIVLIIGNNHHYSWSNSDAKKLLYTAISRAKSKCFILGDSKLFSIAQSTISSTKPSLFLKSFNNYEF